MEGIEGMYVPSERTSLNTARKPAGSRRVYRRRIKEREYDRPASFLQLYLVFPYGFAVHISGAFPSLQDPPQSP